MSFLHPLRGAQIPEAGEAILPSLGEFARTTGSIRAVESVAAARSILTGAETAGLAPSPQYPAYFQIYGILWWCEGKGSDTAWDIKPVSEREFVSTPSTDSSTYTYADGFGARIVATSPLAARGYDRMVEADACLYGSVTGSVDLGIHIGTKRRYVRFSTGQNTQTLRLTAKVPAGTSPGINLVVYPRLPGSSISLTGATDYVGLDVAASPVAMA